MQQQQYNWRPAGRRSLHVYNKQVDWSEQVPNSWNIDSLARPPTPLVLYRKEVSQFASREGSLQPPRVCVCVP